MFLRRFGLYCSVCFGSLSVCPSSVRVVATFPLTLLFPLLCSVLSILCTCCSHFSSYSFISFTVFCAPVFCLIHWFFSLSSFVIPSRCLKTFICAASKRCSSLFFSTEVSLFFSLHVPLKSQNVSKHAVNIKWMFSLLGNILWIFFPLLSDWILRWRLEQKLMHV